MALSRLFIAELARGRSAERTLLVFRLHAIHPYKLSRSYQYRYPLAPVMAFLKSLRRFHRREASQAAQRSPIAAHASHPAQSASTRRVSVVPAGVDITRIYANKDNLGERISAKTIGHIFLEYEEPWLLETRPYSIPLKSFDRPDELHTARLILHPLTFEELRRNYEVVPRVRDDPNSKPILRKRSTPRPMSVRSNPRGRFSVAYSIRTGMNPFGDTLNADR